MTITPEMWNIIVNVIASMQSCPSWLKAQACLTWETASQLPIVDAASDGQNAIPIVEKKIVTQDYLDFLREQIALNPRGPEWLVTLKNRLAALEPFVSEELIVVAFHCKPHSAILRILPKNGNLVHIEVDGV
jgi:hypothetical protein